MRGIVKLFVPATQYKDEEYMRDLIDRMDRNNDGMIAYEEFVLTLKEMGEPDFFRSVTHPNHVQVWIFDQDTL